MKNLAAASLSPRELQIVEARAAGLSYREAAEALGISVHTVREHWRRARRSECGEMSPGALLAFVQLTKKATRQRHRQEPSLLHQQSWGGRL